MAPTDITRSDWLSPAVTAFPRGPEIWPIRCVRFSQADSPQPACIHASPLCNRQTHLGMGTATAPFLLCSSPFSVLGIALEIRLHPASKAIIHVIQSGPIIDQALPKGLRKSLSRARPRFGVELPRRFPALELLLAVSTQHVDEVNAC